MGITVDQGATKLPAIKVGGLKENCLSAWFLISHKPSTSRHQAGIAGRFAYPWANGIDAEYLFLKSLSRLIYKHRIQECRSTFKLHTHLIFTQNNTILLHRISNECKHLCMAVSALINFKGKKYLSFVLNFKQNISNYLCDDE